MHDETGDQIDFRLNPNQGWRFDEAVRVSASLDDVGVYLLYLEHPIRVDVYGMLAKLRERTTQPIGPNGDTYIAHNQTKMIKKNAQDVAIIDITPVGGISAVRQLAGIAEDPGVPATHHSMFDLGVRIAAIVHIVNGIPGFNLPPDSVYYAYEYDILAESLSVEDGAIPVLDGPGLGVEVDEYKVADYATDLD